MFSWLFHKKRLTRKTASSPTGRRRTLTLETLELREMLSVSPLPYFPPSESTFYETADLHSTHESRSANAGFALEAETNDPYANQQWSHDAVDVGRAWDISDGTGVVVAVLDSGVAINHPDLKENIWVNTAEIAGDNIDNDGNGYIDDIHGWNFVGGHANVTDNDGHGTHVAGIIGAVANNGIGVAGAAPGVKILPLKIIEGSSGSTSAIVAALNYLIDLRESGVNVAVANMSLGYLAEDPAVGEAIRRAGAAGVVVVASAGNNGANNDSIPHYPSDYSTDMDHVIAVASVDQRGQLSGSSNYGPTTVDVAAPGVSIYSTTYDGKYGMMSGTSMAAPLVSAAAAILAANDLELSPAGIKARILEACTPQNTLVGKVATGGILNIGQIFVTRANSPPIPPSELEILVVQGNQLTLHWQDNSQNETGFELQSSTDGGKTWTTISSVEANVTTKTVEFAANSASRFRVRATNEFGSSSWAAVAVMSLEAPKKPSTPSGGRATANGAEEIIVTWKAVAHATAYRVERALSNKGEWQEVYLGSDTKFLDDNNGEGLRSSTKYYYRVTAINLSVASKTSSVFSATTDALPPEGMPGGVTAIAESTSKIRVTWDAVKNATQYIVERSTDGVTWKKVKTLKIKTPDDVTETEITGHKAATTYYFRVTAASSSGSSNPSNEVSATTFFKTPNAPRLTILEDGSVQVKWTSVKNAIRYDIERVLAEEADDPGAWETIAALYATENDYIDTEITPNTLYHYRIFVQGAASGGGTIESAPSKSKAIRSAPPPVENLKAAEIGPRQITLTWEETPGALRYTVQKNDGRGWRNAGTTKTNSLVVRSLAAEASYQFRVVAVGQDGNSAPSDTLDVTTPFDVPKTPGSLRIQAMDDDTAALTWKESVAADFYRIYRNDPHASEWILMADDVTTLFYTDTDLEAATKYRYRVVGVNDSGESVRAASSTVTTLRSATDEIAPDSLDVVNATKSSIKLSFHVSEEGFKAYRIQWSTDGTNWLDQKTFRSSSGVVVVSGLRPDTEYYFRIRFEQAKRLSDWSDVFQSWTLEP